MLKKFTYANMNKICTLCLTLGILTFFKGVSFVLFGEPKYPVPEDFAE